IELDVEAYRIDRIGPNPSIGFMRHKLVLVDATPRKETRRMEAGAILVRTAQPLGSLAAYLLEPQALDGLAGWNFFNEVKEGGEFPVLRLPAHVPITADRVRPLPEDRSHDRPFTEAMLRGDQRPPNFFGSPVSIADWLDDGEHFLQVKEGKLWKVQAVTGRCQPLHDSDKLAKALAALPTIGKDKAQELASAPHLELNPQKTGALFQHENDLYFATLVLWEGEAPAEPCKTGSAGAAPSRPSRDVLLTKPPGTKELVPFSPHAELAAFTGDSNL